MKEENGYWQDKNNNKWATFAYSRNRAIKLSKTLINCWHCVNCWHCTDCRNCFGCSFCSECFNCWHCAYCTDCKDCTNCTDFKENPQRIVSTKIGSERRQTTIYWVENNTLVVTGCFSGTLEEFKKAIKKTHADNQHAKEYFNWIEKVENYIKT